MDILEGFNKYLKKNQECLKEIKKIAIEKLRLKNCY